MNFLKHYDIPCIIIATKADKIPKGKWQKHLKITKETLELDPNDHIVLFSSETGIGKEEAWSVLKSICGQRQSLIRTNKNRYLR